MGLPARDPAGRGPVAGPAAGPAWHDFAYGDPRPRHQPAAPDPYLALFPRARVWSLVPFLFFIPLRIPAWLVLGLWFVLQWVYSFSPATGGAVAYVAHVFGFQAGTLVGLVVRAASPGQRPARLP